MAAEQLPGVAGQLCSYTEESQVIQSTAEDANWLLPDPVKRLSKLRGCYYIPLIPRGQ